ncbi:MAG: M56 family metallopeptidase [Caulobacterales bacterium]|nr:M56 family metallopeptidase [Caulobacterales bacterium]
MGEPELLALSLGVSVAVAVLAWAVGRLAERLSDDPRLRDRVWAAALALPALPPVAVGALLLAPAPVREVGAPTLTVAGPAVGAAPAPALEAAPPALAFDPTIAAWAVLALAGGLMLLRLVALALRARRLARILRDTETAPPEVMARVRAAAQVLGVAPPVTRMSTTADEALLSGLGRTRLILPAALIDGTAEPAAAGAVIAHELAHLKRGDHRALWLEEALAALLVANPLMPVLRERRDAAREEACDALALERAAPETRRAYAQTLIEALRSRAGPQGAGTLPALTFTGAGRTTAMHRLKAVLNPAAPAGRRVRLSAVGTVLTLLAAAGAASFAVAAQREPNIRIAVQGNPTIVRINGVEVPGAETLPKLRWAAEAISVSAESVSPRRLDLRVSLDASAPPLSIEGVKLPAGVTRDIVHPEDVARIERTREGLNIVLRRDDGQARPAADRTALTPEQEARYRDPTAAEYRGLCASPDPADGGFCAGVIFSQFPGDGAVSGGDICLPAELDGGDEAARRAALGALVERTKAEIARASIQPGEHPADVARSALANAYPCA